MSTIADGLCNGNIVRSMPNTPGQIGQGITVWTAASQVEAEQRQQAESLLGALGEQIYAADRTISGHGDCAKRLGTRLCVHVHGSAVWTRACTWDSRGGTRKRWLRRRCLDPCCTLGSRACIRRSCATRSRAAGGTTAAALHEMEKGGLRTVLSEGVWAAYRRSQALGGE